MYDDEEMVALTLTRTTMVPVDDLLPDVLPTDRLNVRAMPLRPLRDELRRIPVLRNTISVVMALVQTFGVVIAAAVIGTWWACRIAFLLMGRGHCLLNILGHEAAHRLLFPNRRVNDFIGRWLLAYPTFQAFTAYRRVHFAHHRDELGPEEPEPRAAAATRSPPTRGTASCAATCSGSASRTSRASGTASAREMSRPARSSPCRWSCSVAGRARRVARLRRVGAVVVDAVEVLEPRPRAIAEHGGMERSADRRRTTHVIRQTRLARYLMVPYNTGWHLAHHVDMGVPWRNLPALHAELVRSGWLVPDVEYRAYRSFWKACSAGRPRQPAS